MILHLPPSLTEELTGTLDTVVRDMSSEIADADNAAYRRFLDGRRKRLRAVLSKLDGPAARDARPTRWPG